MGSVLKNSSRDRGKENQHTPIYSHECTLHRLLYTGEGGVYFHRLDVTVLNGEECSLEICYNFFIPWSRNN